MKVFGRLYEAFLVVIASFWLFGHLLKAIVLLPVTICQQRANSSLGTATRQRRIRK